MRWTYDWLDGEEEHGASDTMALRLDGELRATEAHVANREALNPEGVPCTHEILINKGAFPAPCAAGGAQISRRLGQATKGSDTFD